MENTPQSSATLKALADRTRLEICRRLAFEELCVCHLVEDLGLGQPLVSHHLKVLREAGLLESRRVSYWTYYQLTPLALSGLVDELAVLRGQAFMPKQTRPCPNQLGGETMASWVEGYVLDQHVRGVIERLAQEFEGTFSPETIERFVVESSGHLADARVRGYVTLLTERFARRACGPALRQKE